jgi:arylsulfatase A-like enzyme
VCASGTALSADEQLLFTRLQAAYAAMLDHADQQIGRLLRHLDESGQRENTLVLVLSDNGASQEGGPLGMVNAMGPYNFLRETLADKVPASTTSAGPTPTAIFRMAGRWRPTRRCAATSRTPTVAASAIRW